MPFITLNGHTLFYREQGSGPLLIILPGNTASSIWHERELAEFGRSHHAVALDLLGTGQSQRMEVWPRIGGNRPRGMPWRSSRLLGSSKPSWWAPAVARWQLCGPPFWTRQR